MNEYLLLIRENLENYGQMSPQEMQDDIQKHVEWVESLIKKGQFKGGNPLNPEGNQVKGSSKLVTDGPFIEAKEGISGFYFLLADSLTEATEIAKGCPSLELGASLEIREIIQVSE